MGIEDQQEVIKPGALGMKKYYVNLLTLISVFAIILFSCKKDNTQPEIIEKDPPVQDVYTNGSVIKYIDNGDPDKRINMVFIGDGFALSDQPKWRDHVDEMLENLFSSELGQPFGRYQKFFNVYRIDMISEHSGLDLLNRYTPLRGMTSCRDWPAGDCFTDWSRTHDAIDNYMADFGNPDITFREVALNSIEHFGSVHYPARGLLNTYSAGHGNTVNIFIHENGHIAGKLADEYVNDAEATYSGSEPAAVNVTTVLNPLKWECWVGYDMPYTINGSPTIGAYEGAKYVGKGIYRPAEQCMMNRYTNPFCAVCREKIILDFYRKARPVDTVLVSLPEISVELVDPDLFNVRWYVDDDEVASSGLFIDLSTLGLSSGVHTVRILVSDKILEFSYTGAYFDWVRRDTNLLKQEIVKVLELQSN